MTAICELRDAELDAVCGGSIFSGPLIVGPIVEFDNSFNTVTQTSTQVGVVFGGNLQQIAGILGVAGSII